MRNFVAKRHIFELNGPSDLYQDCDFYTIRAHYPSHENGDLFYRINRFQKEIYFIKSRIRRKQILRGWNDIDNLITGYLKDKFGSDYEKLPFRESAPAKLQFEEGLCGRGG